MPNPMYEAQINLIDSLNPHAGYKIRVMCGTVTLLYTTCDPVTGEALLTFADALRATSFYQ